MCEKEGRVIRIFWSNLCEVFQGLAVISTVVESWSSCRETVLHSRKVSVIRRDVCSLLTE